MDAATDFTNDTKPTEVEITSTQKYGISFSLR